MARLTSSSPNAGRRGKPWRRVRAQVLAISTICHICGHDGADSADHYPVSRADAIAAGRYDLLEDIRNLQPAHHHPCPVCGIRCNTSAGRDHKPRSRPSRAW